MEDGRKAVWSIPYVSTTILKVCTKKAGTLFNAPRILLIHDFRWYIFRMLTNIPTRSYVLASSYCPLKT